MRLRLRYFLIVALVVVAGLVIVGNVATAHTNPPVTHAIAWDSSQTEQLTRAACFDCHSNETVWPWYSYIAPMSFLVARDTEEGRDAMNFSTGQGLEGGEMIEQIRQGEMPPAVYLPLHPAGNLSAEQKDVLIAGLRATFGGEGGRGSGEDDD